MQEIAKQDSCKNVRNAQLCETEGLGSSKRTATTSERSVTFAKFSWSIDLSHDEIWKCSEIGRS